MKIEQHPFPNNMVEINEKTKVLTSEAARKNASVDPDHQVAKHDEEKFADDRKGKKVADEGTNAKRAPGVIITRRRPRQEYRQS